MTHDDKVMREILAALRAIAEGYKVSGKDDRYIVVENPKFSPENGSDPMLVIDVDACADHLASQPTQTEVTEVMVRDAVIGMLKSEGKDTTHYYHVYEKLARAALTAALTQQKG
jgi:hypothetical protein